MRPHVFLGQFQQPGECCDQNNFPARPPIYTYVFGSLFRCLPDELSWANTLNFETILFGVVLLVYDELKDFMQI